MPESWCVTYLSTYLVPISAATRSPAESRFLDIESSTSSEISVTLNPSSAIPPEETSIETAPPVFTTSPSTDSELIILRIVPDTPDGNRLKKRDIGGFVGSPAEICSNADTFRLVDSQLLAGNGPVYFNGEDFKLFAPEQGDVPEGAITRTFFRDGDIIRFQSSRITPNGEAGFRQTPLDGQVYITFSSQPAGCITVRLAVIGSQDCQDGAVSSTAIATSQAQQPSVSSLGPIIVAPSSSEEAPPVVTTRPGEPEPPIVTTRPDGVVTTKGPIIGPNPSTTFRWSNTSTSQPPPETFQSSFVPFSTFTFASDSSTLVEEPASTEDIKPESSTIEQLTSDIKTSTGEAGTTAEETATETLTVETTVETTTEGPTTLSTTHATTDTTTAKESTTFSTAQETTTAQEETTVTTTAEITDTTTEEQTTDNPTTTTFTSVLDSTTETTTEAATTTTAESLEIVCPSNPQQCIRSFQIQCDIVIGGIPLTSGGSTLEQCSQACFNDPNCVIFTHSGTQCFSTADSSKNQGSFAIQGWVSGIRATC